MHSQADVGDIPAGTITDEVDGRGPTVLLVVHQGFVARFLLRTDVLTTLEQAGCRIVVLTPNPDEPYLREEFGPDVVFEQLDADASMTQRSRVWSLLYHLRSFTLADGHRARTLQDKYRLFAATARREGNQLVASVIGVGLRALWRSRILRRMLLAIETRMFRPQPHRHVFERERPQLVVTTSPGYFHPDAVVLREAEALGIPTATVVLSWDNPTSKGYRGADPDRIVVWSDRMAEQVARFQDFPRERIAVGGVPHFDHYVREDALLGRDELCARLGLDPSRRIVLFCASSPGTAVDDVALTRTLADAMEGGALDGAQLVVRPHPISFRGSRDPAVDRLEELATTRTSVHLAPPDIVSMRLRCDMSARDGLIFGSLVSHADVLVNVFSTTTLEAFLADTPVVLVSPEIDGSADVRPFDEFTHIRSIAESGAVEIARSHEELVAHVRRALADPSRGAVERRALARTECGPLDGRSGVRIAGMLLEQLMAAAHDGSQPPIPGGR